MQMNSKIGRLAKERGFKNPQALSYEARITRETINNIWTAGDIKNTRIGTLHKIACALGVKITDLYEIR